ncbi:hypothetical protein PYCC9005_005659 [Savitreella phatthalungensis]
MPRARDLLDYGASSGSDSDTDAGSIFTDDSVPTAGQVPRSTRSVDNQDDVDHAGDDRIKSTYLERFDYRQLLDSLRVLERQDTARHLLQAHLMKQQTFIRDSSDPAISATPVTPATATASATPTASATFQRPRARWSAWPLPPAWYSHADFRVSDRLAEQISAALHRVGNQTLDQGQIARDEDLPEHISAQVTSGIVVTIRQLLEQLHATRQRQVVRHKLTSAEAMDRRQLGSILKGRVSKRVYDRWQHRMDKLLGEDMEYQNGGELDLQVPSLVLDDLMDDGRVQVPGRISRPSTGRLREHLQEQLTDD